MVSENELDRFQIELTKSILESRPPKFLYYNKRYDIDSLRHITSPIDTMSRDFNIPETWATVSPDHDDETHQRGLVEIEEFFDVDGYIAADPPPTTTAGAVRQPTTSVVRQLSNIYQPSLGAHSQTSDLHPALKAVAEHTDVPNANVIADTHVDRTMQASNPPMPSMGPSPQAMPTPATAASTSAHPLTPPGATIEELLSAEPQLLTDSIPPFTEIPPIDHPISQTHSQLQVAISSPDGVTNDKHNSSPAVPAMITQHFSPLRPPGPEVLNPQDSPVYLSHLSQYAVSLGQVIGETIDKVDTTSADLVHNTGVDSNGATHHDRDVTTDRRDNVTAEETDPADDAAVDSELALQDTAMATVDEETADSPARADTTQQNAPAGAVTGGVEQQLDDEYAPGLHMSGDKLETEEPQPEDEAMDDDSAREPDVFQDSLEVQEPQPEDEAMSNAEPERGSETPPPPLQRPKTKRKAAQTELAALTTGDPESAFDRFVSNIDVDTSRKLRRRGPATLITAFDEDEKKPAGRTAARKDTTKPAPRKIDTKPATRVTKSQLARKTEPAPKRKR